jgi:hypothetical protein
MARPSRVTGNRGRTESMTLPVRDPASKVLIWAADPTRAEAGASAGDGGRRSGLKQVSIIKLSVGTGVGAGARATTGAGVAAGTGAGPPKLCSVSSIQSLRGASQGPRVRPPQPLPFSACPQGDDRDRHPAVARYQRLFDARF